MGNNDVKSEKLYSAMRELFNEEGVAYNDNIYAKTILHYQKDWQLLELAYDTFHSLTDLAANIREFLEIIMMKKRI